MYIFYTECCDVDISDKTLDVYIKVVEDTIYYPNSLINSLDFINFNIFICMFLLACILSFLCRSDNKHKKYIAINASEPKLTFIKQ
jgi:hypothetical protein